MVVALHVLKSLTHKHELESGRRSAVSQAIIGFGPGDIVNYSNVRNLTWSDVVENASTVLTFLDQESGWT